MIGVIVGVFSRTHTPPPMVMYGVPFTVRQTQFGPFLRCWLHHESGCLARTAQEHPEISETPNGTPAIYWYSANGEPSHRFCTKGPAPP
jgi:hypothetical protein